MKLPTKKFMRGGLKDPSDLPQFKDFGKDVFSGKVADAYLKKQGASVELLDDPTWVKTQADVVAAAVLEW